MTYTCSFQQGLKLLSGHSWSADDYGHICRDCLRCLISNFGQKGIANLRGFLFTLPSTSEGERIPNLTHTMLRDFEQQNFVAFDHSDGDSSTPTVLQSFRQQTSIGLSNPSGPRNLYFIVRAHRMSMVTAFVHGRLDDDSVDSKIVSERLKFR